MYMLITRKKILAEGITQRSDDTTLTVEKNYSTNFTARNFV